MPRGIDGRLEQAFASAKEKGEAAFVTFVTAGYPQKQGACLAGLVFLLFIQQGTIRYV